MKQEVILAQIAATLNQCAFLIKTDEKMEEILKSCGLKDEYEENDIYFKKTIPNYYNGRTYHNPNEDYSFFRGINNIFESLMSANKTDDIILLLSTIGENLNLEYIGRNDSSDYERLDKLTSLYELMHLKLDIIGTKVIVKTWSGDTCDKVNQIFTLESWLNKEYPKVYEAYISAIDALKDGHAGACIESCRTTLTGIFSQFKGLDEFAKWTRGLGNVSDELPGGKLFPQDTNAFKKAIESPSKNDLADFFKENRNGRFTKTRAIYSIYSMMSDYGTHREEGTPEEPTSDDALMMLRMTEDILIWIFKRTAK